MTTFSLNQELNGVEIFFDSKPAQDILNGLKEMGFRWSNFKKCWYAKQNEKTLAIAQKIVGGEVVTEVNADYITKVNKSQYKYLSLWDLTRWSDSIQFNSKLSTKEIASEVRKHVKSRFSMCKFSITSTYSSIQFYITASPFEKDSIYLKAIEDYCTSLLKAYCYCTCDDPYGDYGSSYNFYGAYARIDYAYTLTELTESIKADILDFDIKNVAFEQAEEERKELEYQQREIERAEEHKQHLIRVEEEKKQIEIINNSVTVTDIDESKQYFVIGSQFAHINKNCTLDEYKEEVTKGEYELQNVKINREIHFTNKQALEFFSNMLLNDFDFFSQTGGSFTDDNRIQTMTDYNNMIEDERKTVVFNLYGVAIYYNNQLQFVVDTQGFSYARYVGLVENIIIQNELVTEQVLTVEQVTEYKSKAESIEDISFNIIAGLDIVKTWNNENWATYKELMKEQLKKHNIKLSKSIIQQLTEDSETLKVAMYKLLIEVDGIQEQFRNADLQQGQKVTLFYIGDMGGLIASRITLDKVEYKSYAQYDNAVKLTFAQQGEKGLYSNHWYSTLLVYDGWFELPINLLNTVETRNGMTITSGKYHSCDHKMYDDIIEYFTTKDIKPIVNTHKPIF